MARLDKETKQAMIAHNTVLGEPELIKVDRNGSKHWRGMKVCERCGGVGYYAVGVMNGELVLSSLDDGICWWCHGAGKTLETWIERTPEYEAKLAERREERRAKNLGYESVEAMREAQEAERKRQEEERKQREEEQARLEAERKAEAERREAEKARSQFVGTVGEKITVKATYLGSPYFDRNVFGKSERTYIHQFSVDGNKLVWMTGSYKNIPEEAGTVVELTGTVKDHNEYKGEKQTSLLRCKIS